ncbi:hypothetical protein FHEFKHOI_01800 [Candidatus Methanoperedenaceae archaeon GB50]|nr:MAG: hypothetical protein KBONHNOK_00155 [Candidatus Methanoperedenaceae archaeon GB50]CAD7775513.1 hypothetical protein AIOGIFDO_01794 [Candidatus Methanoperedenaceae archaeon GB37]CAD7775611.1 hypothetical protein FHEFKHOI_01800 [Candidatus Methanoperedenaceae archaeon GB50]
MKAKLLRIYFGESDRFEGRSAYHAVVEYLRRSGVSGATVFRGIEGYGVRSILHTASILRLSEDLPIVVEVVETEDRLNPILPELLEIVKDELVILMDVEVLMGHKFKKTV